MFIVFGLNANDKWFPNDSNSLQVIENMKIKVVYSASISVKFASVSDPTLNNIKHSHWVTESGDK